MAWWRREKAVEQPKEERVVTVHDVFGDALPGEVLDLLMADTTPFTVRSATRLTAVWAAVNFLSDTIAALPLQVFKLDEDAREPLRNETVYKLLHNSPNDEWTAFDFWKYLFWQTFTEGRGLAYIQRGANNQITGLWPLEPARTSVHKIGLARVYKYRESTGQVKEYSSKEIIDITFALDTDQVTHLSPLRENRDAIQLGLGLQNFAKKLFDRGGVPPLSLEGPFNSGAGAANASKDISTAIQNAAKEGRIVLPMPMGHALKELGIDPEKGQVLESRVHSIQEVARIYQLPPIFLQDLTNGTYANAEQQDLQLVKHTLTTWIVRIEQELNLKLFRAGTRFAEYNLDGLLRGDFKTRMEGYAKGIQNSIFVPNEARRKENMPAMEGGDSLVIQQNMTPLGKLEKKDNEPPAANGDDDENGN